MSDTSTRDISTDRCGAAPADEADKKTRFVTVRCSSAQRQQLKVLAAGQGFSIGAYIRATLLGSPGLRSHRRPSFDTVALAQLTGYVGHLGSNMNQIAKTMHQAGYLADHADVLRAVADIADIRAALMQALGRRPRAAATVDQVRRLGHQG